MTCDDSHCLLALDAGGTTIKVALVTQTGTMLPACFGEIPIMEHGNADALAATFEQAASFGASHAAARALCIDGIGVSIPGPFDYTAGISRMTHKYAAIRGLPIRPWLEKGVGKTLPIHFLHDSAAFLSGETWSGAYVAYSRICGVIIGTGLGCASLLEGKIWENDCGGPGLSIYRRPYREGTAEDFISKRGIMARYGGDLSVKEIAARARDGQPEALRVWKDTGDMLGEILAPLLAEYQFDCLVLGGQIAKAGELLRAPLAARLTQLGFTGAVRKAAQIDEAPLLGAVRSLTKKITENACI
ncbi:MAG: ROK family protein [Clostridia bacterium]